MRRLAPLLLVSLATGCGHTMVVTQRHDGYFRTRHTVSGDEVRTALSVPIRAFDSLLYVRHTSLFTGWAPCDLDDMPEYSAGVGDLLPEIVALIRGRRRSAEDRYRDFLVEMLRESGTFERVLSREELKRELGTDVEPRDEMIRPVFGEYLIAETLLFEHACQWWQFELKVIDPNEDREVVVYHVDRVARNMDGLDTPLFLPIFNHYIRWLDTGLDPGSPRAWAHRPATQLSGVKIGTQTWASENLNTNRFRNGDLIPQVVGEKEWVRAFERGQPAWTHPYFDPEHGSKYGKLYNYHAVHDPRGLAPEGWHIPTRKEWATLNEHVGGMFSTGADLKAREWKTLEGEPHGTNTTGFSALPGGYFRSPAESVDHDPPLSRWWRVHVPQAGWWSWKPGLSSRARVRYWTTMAGFPLVEHADPIAGLGLSVRCVQ